ncbi:methyltransferase, FxLD system [Streptosporangium jomthongense]|uniref:Protein-L-isoaspartate O-methyltransferase n=1 Tax=Streptosporangium jomthongense TaxID=1193683 RepID=A0ABV8EYE8_9ACTN
MTANADPRHATWREISYWCTTWQAAEQAAVTRLGDVLTGMTRSGVVASWWFVRKGTRWRVRYLPAATRDDDATSMLENAFDEAVAHGDVSRWSSVIYEPLLEVFGGPESLAIAHELFHIDSEHVLDHLRKGGSHPRELALLLATSMLRGAGRDWYDQGQVWSMVAEERTTPSVPPTKSEVAAVRELLLADTATAVEHLNVRPDWFDAFELAGRRHADLADQGIPTRGLHAVLAQHVLFTWNRLGIPEPLQGALAGAANRVILHADFMRPNVTAPTSLDAVTTHEIETSPAHAARLRADLVTYIRGRGTFRTKAVETAFGAVERELFLEGVDLDQAYKPQVVVTKLAADGTALSSASHPNLVATQLEDLDLHPGHTALEIGTATGINAALMAEIVGPHGKVVTIEIDDDLTATARDSLVKAGYSHVKVVCGDGAAGSEPDAPFDRMIVTAGAWDLSAALYAQLAVGGRIVIPLRLHGSGLTRSIAFDRHPSGVLTGSHARVCGFVPMRGTSDDTQAGVAVQLADDVALNVDARDAADEEALVQALTHPANERWTGVYISDYDLVDHLDLWLATNTGAFGRLVVGSAARKSGLIDPALRWAGAALYDGGTIAYLTLRQHGPISEELGITAHGPDGERLAAHLTELLHQWNRTRPAQPIITAYPAGTPDDRLAPGIRIERPDTRLTISW